MINQSILCKYTQNTFSQKSNNDFYKTHMKHANIPLIKDVLLALALPPVLWATSEAPDPLTYAPMAKKSEPMMKSTVPSNSGENLALRSRKIYSLDLIVGMLFPLHNTLIVVADVVQLHSRPIRCQLLTFRGVMQQSNPKGPKGP